MGIQNAKRIVVKVGSSLVTNNGEGLDHAAITNWAEQVAGLQKSGCEVLMVSSGAIAEGMQHGRSAPLKFTSCRLPLQSVKWV